MVKGSKKRDLLQLGGLLVILVAFNLMAGRLFTRFDFTKEKRYTLAPVSRNLMDSLPKPIKITVYLEGGNLPVAFKRLQQSTRDMLLDLQAYSHGKLNFEFVDPLSGIAEQQQNEAIQNLQAKGIDPTNLSVKTDNGFSQKIIFPGALAVCDGKQIAVRLLQTRIGLSPDEVLNNSIQNLQYALVSGIQKAISDGKPAIGFTEGHRELSDLQINDAMRSLSDGFEVGRVNLKTIGFAGLQRLKLLIIPKPETPFTEQEKFMLDQYVMHGGKVVWSIDEVSAELDSLHGHSHEQMTFPKQLNLDDQLFTYGIRINNDLIADMSCVQIPVNTGNIAGQGQMQMVPWLFYPIFMPSSKHPLVKNLDGIRSEFASTIDTLATKGTRKTVLLSSSPFNRKLTVPYMLSLQMLEEVPDPKTFQSPPKTVGVLLEGKFISAFRNRPLPESVPKDFGRLQQSVPTKMIVFSDGDLFKNQTGSDGSVFPLGYDKYTRQSYGNKNLLLNIADYMTGDPRLIVLRNQEIRLRLLNKPRVRAEKLYWQLLNTVVPIGLVLICAIFQHYTRKRRYAR